MFAVYASFTAEGGYDHLHQKAYELLACAYKREFSTPTLPTIAKTEKGKPYFVDSTHHFSICHTDCLVAVVIADCPVGIDAEESSRRISDGVAKRFLHRDSASVNDWTKYECIAKMLGCGIPLSANIRIDDYQNVYEWRIDEYTVCVVSAEPRHAAEIHVV